MIFLLSHVISYMSNIYLFATVAYLFFLYSLVIVSLQLHVVEIHFASYWY